MQNRKHKHDWHYTYLLSGTIRSGKMLPASKMCRCGKVFEYKAGKILKQQQSVIGIRVDDSDQPIITFK